MAWLHLPFITMTSPRGRLLAGWIASIGGPAHAASQPRSAGPRLRPMLCLQHVQRHPEGAILTSECGDAFTRSSNVRLASLCAARFWRPSCFSCQLSGGAMSNAFS